MDKHNLIPGQRWSGAIMTALKNADFVLVFLSSRSVSKRGFLRKEIRIALSLWHEKLEDDIYLIPVRLEPCQIPQPLKGFQYVDLFKEAGLEKLIRSLEEGIKLYHKETNTTRLLDIEPINTLPESIREQIAWGVGKTINELTNTDLLKITNLDFPLSTISESELQYLNRFPALKRLNLLDTPINDSILQYIGELISLEALVLSTPMNSNFEQAIQITDEGLKYLGCLPLLRLLRLDGYKITGRGLNNLIGLKLLTSLSLNDTRIVDDDLNLLSNFPDLNHLSLNSTAISDKGMLFLASIPSLYNLELTYSQITDKGLKYLINCKFLRSLDLRGNQISDQSLKYLIRINSLKNVLVVNTKVTEKGVAIMRNQRPDLFVARTYSELPEIPSY